MDVMETIQTILAICGGISVIGGAAAVIHKWIAPAVKLNDRVETLERHAATAVAGNSPPAERRAAMIRLRIDSVVCESIPSSATWRRNNH